MIGKRLERLGHSSTMTINGLECVEEYQRASGEFDLVLMDLNMPVMCGLDACRAIRGFEKTKKLRKVPVIVISGYSIQSTLVDCISAGVDGYVRKPIDFTLLQKVLYGAIDPAVKFQLKEGLEGGWF